MGCWLASYEYEIRDTGPVHQSTIAQGYGPSSSYEPYFAIFYKMDGRLATSYLFRMRDPETNYLATLREWRSNMCHY
jgi:hypothetical protein